MIDFTFNEKLSLEKAMAKLRLTEPSLFYLSYYEGGYYKVAYFKNPSLLLEGHQAHLRIGEDNKVTRFSVFLGKGTGPTRGHLFKELDQISNLVGKLPLLPFPSRHTDAMGEQLPWVRIDEKATQVFGTIYEPWGTWRFKDPWNQGLDSFIKSENEILENKGLEPMSLMVFLFGAFTEVSIINTQMGLALEQGISEIKIVGQQETPPKFFRQLESFSIQPVRRADVNRKLIEDNGVVIIRITEAGIHFSGYDNLCDGKNHICFKNNLSLSGMSSMTMSSSASIKSTMDGYPIKEFLDFMAKFEIYKNHHKFIWDFSDTLPAFLYPISCYILDSMVPKNSVDSESLTGLSINTNLRTKTKFSRN